MHGVVFVVDASDRARLDEARIVLCTALAHPYVKGKPLLVLANKQDKAEEEGCEIEPVFKLQKALGLTTSTSELMFQVKECAAKRSTKRSTDKDIATGVRWLLQMVKANEEVLAEKLEDDMAKQKAVEDAERAAKRERVRLLREEREREREAREARNDHDDNGKIERGDDDNAPPPWADRNLGTHEKSLHATPVVWTEGEQVALVTRPPAERAGALPPVEAPKIEKKKHRTKKNQIEPMTPIDIDRHGIVDRTAQLTAPSGCLPEDSDQSVASPPGGGISRSAAELGAILTSLAWWASSSPLALEAAVAETWSKLQNMEKAGRFNVDKLAARAHRGWCTVLRGIDYVNLADNDRNFFVAVAEVCLLKYRAETPGAKMLPAKRASADLYHEVKILYKASSEA